VLDPDGSPVEGAVVEGLRIGRMGMEPSLPVPFPLGRTGAGGRLRWPEGDLPFPCILRASHGAFAPGEAVAIAREAEAVLRLRRGFAIEGSVVDEGGAPVDGAAVGIVVLPASHVLGCQLGVTGSVAREGRSGPDGRFRVAGLPPAFQGIVSARAEGFQEGRVAWSAMDGRPPRVVLQRPFRSVVRVRDRMGRPVDGASVWIFAGPRVRFGRWMPAEPEVLPLPAAGTGLYAREDLPAGWTSVLVARSGFRIVVREDAAFGRDLGPVEVVLEEVPGLRGRVVWGDTKEPVEGVKVRATPLKKVAPTAREEEAQAWYWPVSEMEGPFTAVTGKDGTYALPVFGPSDSLKIEARGEDGTWGSGSHPAYGERESAAVRDVWLHRLRRDVDYTGRVVSPAGDPIPGALVVGFADVAAAGPDGRFRLVSRQPGAFVEVMAPGFVSRSPPVPGRSASGGGFGARDLGDVVLPPLREVRGIVVDREGAPVPGAPLWAEPLGRMGLPADAQFSATALSDSGGRFTIRLVPGHRYRVRVFDGSREGGAEVEGDAVEEVRVVVGPDPRAGAGGIRGRLVREDGAWAPRRLTVVLRPEPGGSSGGLSGAVDPGGRFEVHGVPAGSWALRVAGSAEVEGGAAGVRVVPGAYAEVEVPCRVAEAEVAAPAEVRVRLEPATGDVGPVRVFATRGSGPSEVLRAREDGTWGGTAKAGAPWRVWAMDPAASRAGVAAVEPGGAEATVLPLVPAGTLSLPGWEFGTPEPWVEVRDASGAILYSGGITALPVVADRGNCLLLPPGPCTVEVSTGPERKDPRTLSGTSEAGRTKPLE
jgi:hypothetical protein